MIVIMDSIKLPTLHDKESWIRQLTEHRRTLFEQVLIRFASELGTKKSLIDLWRAKLRV
jgi:hypothetical protein